MWYLNGFPFGDDEFEKKVTEGVIGIVYMITEYSTKKKYIGKKMWITTKKLPPLKGQKRRRTKVIQTDWRSYYGSSEHVKTLIEEKGTEEFHREILHFCHNKSELAYIEATEQIQRNALLLDEYYNEFIGLRLHAKGLKRLKDIYNRETS